MISRLSVLLTALLISSQAPISIAQPSGLPAVNVQTMGAKGDGTTDDFEAFKAAIAKADPEKVGSGVIFIPPSNKPYLLSAPVVLRSKETLTAQPRTAVIAPVVPYPTPDKSPLLISVKNASDVTVKGIIFDGQDQSIGSSSPIISVMNCERVLFEEDEIKNARGIGILFSGNGGGVKHSGLKKCKLDNIGKYYLQSGNQKEDRRQSVAFCCGQIGENGEYPNQYNFAVQNTFGYNGFDNLSFGEQSWFTAENNHFAGTHNGGNIYCSHCHHVRIINNTGSGASGNGIDTFVNKDITITGNTSSNNGGSGIMLGDAHCALVEHNKAINNYQSSLPSWANDHPHVKGSNHRGGIVIGGEAGDGTPNGSPKSTDPEGSADILIKNNLLGDNQPKGSRTQMFGIQVRKTASVRGLMITPDNTIFGNTTGPFGEKLTGPTADANAALPCKLWMGEPQ